MALDSYANLKTAIEGWLDNDALTDYIDDFIDIAEARHAREVRIEEMINRQTIMVVARYVDLPVGYLEAKSMRLMTDPVITLESVTPNELNRHRREVAGIPKYFTVHEQIELDREPDQSYTSEMLYYKKLTPLSSTATTNALLAKAPDLYLFSCLASSAPFLMNDERIQVWEQLYQQAKGSLIRSEDVRKRVGTPVARVKGV